VTSKAKTRRIFFALWPSEKQRQKIEAVLAPYRDRLRGKWIARGNWHVTLVFIGSFPERDIGALQGAAASIRRRPLNLKFERIDYWRRPKIMCLSTDFVSKDLLELVTSLEKAAANFDFVPEKRAYRPHMTIARKARFFDPVALARPVELHWSDFRLVESVSTPEGVMYQPLDQ
jgi:2'-5' RNA ligase